MNLKTPYLLQSTLASNIFQDADVTELLEVLQQDEFFKSSDVRDSILSQPTRQQRVATLLDRVESRGDRTFFLLMDALKEHYKQLHSMMEETLRFKFSFS